MLGQLDKNRPYGTVYGVRANCKFTQDGRYFAGNGDEIPEEQALMPPEEYRAMKAAEAKGITSAPLQTDQSDVIAGLNPEPAKTVISEQSRAEYEIELQQYTSHALKKIVSDSGFESHKGVGSTARNIALLLDHKFPSGG